VKTVSDSILDLCNTDTPVEKIWHLLKDGSSTDIKTNPNQNDIVQTVSALG